MPLEQANRRCFQAQSRSPLQLFFITVTIFISSKLGDNFMESIGKSVGAIVQNAGGLYLVQYRLKHPIGLAMPAGHIEENETPKVALHRELREETDVWINGSKLVFHETLQNPCPKDHKFHEWWVYKASIVGKPQLLEPTKHKFLEWMSLEEMLPYIERGEVDPAWFKHILPALKII